MESIVIPTKGRHNVFNAALAYAVGSYFGMGEFEIRRGLLNFHQTGMRQKMYDYKDVHIIEDCYNAGPESTKASLRVLSDDVKRSGTRAVAVLGEMRELGEHAGKLHFEVGKTAAELGIDRLFVLGEHAYDLAEGALSGGMSDRCITVLPEEYAEAAALIAPSIAAGDTLLFKASRALRFELLLEEVKNRL